MTRIDENKIQKINELKSQGLSRKKIAHETGVSQATVANYTRQLQNKPNEESRIGELLQENAALKKLLARYLQ